jgi:hypothetical protein
MFVVRSLLREFASASSGRRELGEAVAIVVDA